MVEMKELRGWWESTLGGSLRCFALALFEQVYFKAYIRWILIYYFSTWSQVCVESHICLRIRNASCCWRHAGA